MRAEFVARANVGEIPTVQRNTLRGVLWVSTPEATAFDLAGYPNHAGRMSNVATILAELVEGMSAARLLKEADHSPLPWTQPQRLGYLLERASVESLAAPLAEYVSKRAKEYVPLRPRKPVTRASRVPRWRLLINEKVDRPLIPFDLITEWESQAPWTSEGKVEQDLILSRAVVELLSPRSRGCSRSGAERRSRSCTSGHRPVPGKLGQ